MSAQIAIYGRLGGDPIKRQSQSGKGWATASLAVDLGKDGEVPSTWFSVIAFGRAAEVLCRHTKGDLLSVGGRLQLNCYRDREGKDREQMQVIADSIISARSVRAGAGRRRETSNQEGGR